MRSIATVGSMAVLLGALAADAYVLPGGAILRRFTEGRAQQQLSTVRVTGSLVVAGEEASALSAALGVTPGGTVELQAEFSMKPPGRCRLEGTSAAGTRFAVVSAQGRRRTEGAEIESAVAAVEQACALLALRGSEGRASVERHLTGIGVDTRRSSLARFGGRVAYVLGAPSSDAPQAWFYKDSFAPARVLFTGRSGRRLDVRLLDYNAPGTGAAFPRVLEVYQGPARVLRFTATSGDTRARLDDKLF